VGHTAKDLLVLYNNDLFTVQTIDEDEKEQEETNQKQSGTANQ
jgi:hypothetical protein